MRQIAIQLEEEIYSQELEDKIDQIHLQLVKACASRLACKNNKDLKE